MREIVLGKRRDYSEGAEVTFVEIEGLGWDMSTRACIQLHTNIATFSVLHVYSMTVIKTDQHNIT